MTDQRMDIDTILKEDRLFPPPASFSASAHVKSMAEYEAHYNKAKDDPEGFWGEIGKELHWDAPWQRVLEWESPFAKWFVGGKTNLSYNCLDRHLARRGDKVGMGDLLGVKLRQAVNRHVQIFRGGMGCAVPFFVNFGVLEPEIG